MITTRNTKEGARLLGNTPLPKGAVLIGTVVRGHGVFDKGALVRMPRGGYVQMLYGTMRSLPSTTVDRLLFSLRDGEAEYRRHVPGRVDATPTGPDDELIR